jgi:hypothetical protein
MDEPFYPSASVVPEFLIAADFKLRPLLESDTDLDYEALMSSRNSCTWPKRMVGQQMTSPSHRMRRIFVTTNVNTETGKLPRSPS